MLTEPGYWMPFETAKAIAATFCWPIRCVLTPIFGLDFLDMCIHPQDRALYGRMIIDQAIVEKATEMTNYYRALELQPLPPRPLFTSRRPPGPSKSLEKQILPKSYPHTDTHHHHHHHLRHDYADSLVSYGSSPEYTPTPSASDTYCMSPASPLRSSFTPVNNIPRSTDVRDTASPRDILCSLQNMPRKRERIKNTSDGESGSGSSDATSSSTLYSSTTSANSPNDYLSDLDADGDFETDDIDDDDDHDYRDTSSSTQAPSKRARASHIETRSGQHRSRSRNRTRNTAKLLPLEVRAAHALLSLYMQDATRSGSCSGSDEDGFVRWQQQNGGKKRRRASA